ncbi:hypothetical protein LTR20_010582 [Exophiala xenobiotica]|nr:hypothetical protein LTR40_003302 [Exophiala xenobiotica]KAK5352583.1 hypothetical protein LTR61_003709 [Exophiala xenobiotica]KAK5375446.1 hypothetical protein LTR11_004996 [Exophiala xenobiotica]KAK5397455.1 hypothetical protein LTR79_004968 [Exophiala xenobiotica]KAK5453680.1 hypothetical protein LTR20_010582 [Exophiala xenobiotica]
MKTFSRETTGVEVVNELADRVNGKTFVITGASEKGLGAETAVALAHANPARLILLARSQSRVESVMARIKELNPAIQVTFVPVSLDDFDSVRSAAATISDSINKLDYLINNAGIMALTKYETNKNGIELQFATNHLGHFLFTKLLMPKILAAAPGSRIVNLTSLGHKIGPVRFNDYNFSNGKEYDPWSAYGQAKTANILFSLGLTQRLRSRGIQSYGVHPGAIFNTNLASHIEDVQASLASIEPVAQKNTGRHFPLDEDPPKPIEQGITTTLVAALDPRIEGQSGMYMADAKCQPTYEYAEDVGNAERLWRLSEELMRALEVYDHVVYKPNRSLYGTVSRTSHDPGHDLEEELIIAHAEVPADALTEFVTTGVPPVGYVFVEFADEAAGSSLVREEDLDLLSRDFQLGDTVKRDGSNMIGTVTDVDEKYTLEPTASNGDIARRLRLLSIDFVHEYPACSPACASHPPLPFSHRNPHVLISNVPSRDIKKASDVVLGDYIVKSKWIGLVDDVEYDVVIGLENKSIVVVTNHHGLYIPVPDYGKPLVTLPEYEELKRPDFVVATQGWATTIPVQTPRPGVFVIIDRSRLRGGRWISGTYDPKCAAQGVVLDVRARDALVGWVSINFGRETLSSRSETSPRSEVPIYENINHFQHQMNLTPTKDVKIYDCGRMPCRNVNHGEASSPQGGDPSYAEAEDTHNVFPGQDLRIGDYVKFRDTTAAAVKYQGSEGSSHGAYLRAISENFPGWDFDEFKVVSVQQNATVLWQDGSTTTCDSATLNGYGLFEPELQPTDIVVKREGMRQRPVGSRGTGDSGVTDFDEMAFFERPHDLIPQMVGVVQTVDPNERVACVRWYEEPRIELRSSGQMLAHGSHYGPIGHVVEDVSLYEILSFPALARRRRDMCLLEDPEEFLRLRQLYDAGGDIAALGEPRLATIRAVTNTRPRRRSITRQRSRHEDHEDPDWTGQVVAHGLDGTLVVRLGAAKQCRDIRVERDAILAYINDSDDADSIDNNMMDVDWIMDNYDDDWSDEGSVEPISESVEYEGGERLDEDAGDENWVSEDDDEELQADGDIEMTDAEPASPETRPSTIQLKTNPVWVLATQAPPQFLVLEEEPPADQFGLHSAQTAGTSLKRIMKEHNILKSSLPEGEIYVRTYESRLDLMRCLIIGPRDTPYENAPFVVDLYLGEGFPDQPPTAHFHSWTSGLGRINPNLYEEGKICLSLLGTWSGKHDTEKWSDKATLLQLLVSLQGLVFVKKPFYNEAGFEGYENDSKYTLEAEQYGEKAFVMARGFIKHALLRPPKGLIDVLGWLYLPHDLTKLGDSLLGTIIDRGRMLIAKSEEARAVKDDSLLDSAGDKDDPTRVFLKPLSRGASVMLKRLLDNLQGQMEQLELRREGEGEDEGES